MVNLYENKNMNCGFVLNPKALIIHDSPRSIKMQSNILIIIFKVLVNYLFSFLLFLGVGDR